MGTTNLRKDLTQEQLREVLDYNPETGIFVWRKSGRTTGSRIVGGEAGFIDSYRSISIKGKSYRAHRLAWLYVYGRWPEDIIDHINGVRDDNRIANLRECTFQQNPQNFAMDRNPKSGFIGVSQDKGDNKWRACISLNRKTINLGYFWTPDEAHVAYLKAKAILHTFEPNVRDLPPLSALTVLESVANVLRSAAEQRTLEHGAESNLDRLLAAQAERIETVTTALSAAPQPDPKCPSCGEVVQFECIACSENNYPGIQPEQPARDGEMAWTEEDMQRPWGAEVAALRHLADDPALNIGQAAILRHCAKRIEATATLTTVEPEIVDRFRTACRALVRERVVYGEDLETLSDVLRALETVTQPPQQADGGAVATVLGCAFATHDGCYSIGCEGPAPLPAGTKLYTHPPKWPGVGVDDPAVYAAMYALRETAAKPDDVGWVMSLNPKQARTILAALGGGK